MIALQGRAIYCWPNVAFHEPMWGYSMSSACWLLAEELPVTTSLSNSLVARCSPFLVFWCPKKDETPHIWESKICDNPGEMVKRLLLKQIHISLSFQRDVFSRERLLVDWAAAKLPVNRHGWSPHAQGGLLGHFQLSTLQVQLCRKRHALNNVKKW